MVDSLRVVDEHDEALGPCELECKHLHAGDRAFDGRRDLAVELSFLVVNCGHPRSPHKKWAPRAHFAKPVKMVSSRIATAVAMRVAAEAAHRTGFGPRTGSAANFGIPTQGGQPSVPPATRSQRNGGERATSWRFGAGSSRARAFPPVSNGPIIAWVYASMETRIAGSSSSAPGSASPRRASAGSRRSPPPRGPTRSPAGTTFARSFGCRAR